jgi:hypothetical protein
MALVVKDRVQETSTTTGTGTLTLSGAATGYQSFSSAIGNGNTTYYAISNGTDWEVGVGTVGSGTLARDTVLESSNAGSLVDFSAGVKTVFCTYPAERSVNTQDIGVSIQAYDADTAKYDDATANFVGTLQNGGSNVVVDSDIGSTVQAYDSTILKSANIGVTVQGYDADTAKYDDTTANFTGTLQKSGSNVLTASNIGSTVQAYDADTAKYDDTTANFTGTLQKSGSNVLTASNIGSSVQAYDSNLTSFVGTFTLPTTDGTANQVMKTDGAGNIGFTTITAGDAYVGSTNTFTANQIISVTDNTNAALRVTQLGSGAALRVEDETNPDSSPFVVASDGKVGIGTPTPSYNLEVYGSEPTSRIYNTNAAYAGMLQIANPSNYMLIGKDRDGSAGWYGNAGQYIIACNGNFPLDVYTNGTKRMTVDANGNVGIGVAPYASWDSVNRRALEIGRGGCGFTINPTNSNANLQVNLYTSSSGNTYANTGYALALNLSSSGGQYTFFNYGTGSAGATATPVEVASIDVSGYLKFNSGYGSSAIAYGCRAWVNFNGTGTVAIRASGNVSSITDGGTGNYTVNFTTALPDANAASVASVRYQSGAGEVRCESWTASSSTARITVLNGTYDAEFVNLSVFR